MMTKRDKRREFRQRTQIAFDMILDEVNNQLTGYTKRIDEFSKGSSAIQGATYMYSTRIDDQSSPKIVRSVALNNYLHVVDDLKKFAQIVPVHCLKLYGPDNRLMAVYQRHEEQETMGLYVLSEQGNETYLSLDDRSQANQMLGGDTPIPDHPLPEGIPGHFDAEIPETVSATLFNEENTLGIRIIVPIYYIEKRVGVFIGEVLYTQNIVERYASLSKTAVNFFAGNRFSVGTLPAQTQLTLEAMKQVVSCEDILTREVELDVFLITFENQGYYQGQCALRNAQGTVGAITVSLSQEIEEQEIKKILTAVFTISAIVSGIAFGFSVIFSRKTIHSIQNIVRVIGSAAEGDLRPTALAVTRDEIGMVATKLNRMIAQLRNISGKVQEAAYTVNGTADTILQQMDTLIRHMEQQSTSVDNTTDSVEKINHFIDAVAQNTNDLLTIAAQILSSIQEMRASVEEVTASIGSLTVNLHLISSSVDQVNQSVKQISEHSGHLAEVAQRTETEVQHIDQSLRDVSHNADRTQQLARETMDAAASGQTSVEASIQGMSEIKEVVSQTAQVIQEVNSWGERVSSILDIVDDITEQTSLLALNASIISAQAGVHGRGFAVVADEIKELATRTKASTKEIGTLIHELQGKTSDGVKKTTEGIAKADQGVQLATAVKDALNTILERATRSSNRATDTAQVIQQTVDSSRIIRTSMQSVTEMVSSIRTSIQRQEQDIEQVVAAVENISGMAEQVNRASVEQTKAAGQIAESMEHVTEEFSDIADQTEELKQNSYQIVTAMHTIESTTEQILQNATGISGETVKNLLHESDVLQQIVSVFKVS
jgi:methyl-accepting chemotaxis protein